MSPILWTEARFWPREHAWFQALLLLLCFAAGGVLAWAWTDSQAIADSARRIERLGSAHQQALMAERSRAEAAESAAAAAAAEARRAATLQRRLRVMQRELAAWRAACVEVQQLPIDEATGEAVTP